MSEERRTLSELGEAALIDRLRARLRDASGVEIGPGDDAALFATGERTLASTDLLIEGVHFDFAFASPSDVGFKAIAVNASDIGAMGGTPRYALVSIAAPAETTLAAWDGVFDGMIEAADAYGMAIVGGDCSTGPAVIINVAVSGEPSPAGVVTRAGARPGDVLCVTGFLGAAATGLELLRSSSDPRALDMLERFPDVAAAYRRPPLRIAAGPAAARAGATAMIDLSDGLARDALHIAQESSLGCVIDASKIPIAAGVREVAAELGFDAVALAAGGGEDYELAIAISPERVDALRQAMAPVSLTIVGELGGDERVLVRNGERVPLEKLGWEHFS